MKSAITLMAATALLAPTSCSKKYVMPSKPETFQQEAGGAGAGGQVVVDTTTTTATITSINASQRKLELKDTDGSVTSYNAGPEVSNFDQLRVGDQVKTKLIREVAVSLAPAGTALRDHDNVVLRVPPSGVGPVLAVSTRTFTAKVLNVDLINYQATLQLADGQSKTVKVSDNINIADVKAGDIVSLRVTEARTFVVDKM